MCYRPIIELRIAHCRSLTLAMFSSVTAATVLLLLAMPSAAQEAPFPNTDRLDWEGDIASRMVEKVDSYLLERWKEARERRFDLWIEGLSSDDVAGFIDARRATLRVQLGLKDPPDTNSVPQFVTPVGQPDVLAEASRWQARYVNWTGFANVQAEGILVEPKDAVLAQIILVPDAGQTIESLVWQDTASGKVPGTASRLANHGIRVLIPAIIDRTVVARNGRAQLSHREFVYRPAFELGRHIIGFDVQTLLSARKWMQDLSPDIAIGLAGLGEGGHLSLYAAAIEPFDSVLISGHFSTAQTLWQEPIDRNVFGRMKATGDAELGAMVLPSRLFIEAAEIAAVELPGNGGAPANLKTRQLEAVREEYERVNEYAKLRGGVAELIETEQGRGQPFMDETMARFVRSLSKAASQVDLEKQDEPIEVAEARLVDAPQRQAKLVADRIAYTQSVLADSAETRRQFMDGIKTDSIPAFEESTQQYRSLFHDEIIGNLSEPLVAPRPRTRRAYQGEGWTGYEVVLDVTSDLFAYGVLLWPDDIEPGEKRPVVVCQHGLEGRPKDVIAGDHPAYHDFAAKLAEQGFIVFAPQNLYIFEDRFRTLQRKANPLGLSLFSVMIPQHEQIVNWLSSLPQVDSSRVAFYGLSYGGKSAMRIPAVLDQAYCLSICSADFNEWVWKNASTRSRYSYVWTGEYEIFEFNLGGTFNYAEMATLIAPRPFMVERGHFDGVAPDEAVAFEFAKVRHLYAAKLGLAERCEIEWFVGPHTINGKGTFEFLKRHLRFPEGSN